MNQTNLHTRRAVLVAGLGLLPAAAGGCALLGAVAHKVSGPVVTPPAYVLLQETTVVLVERRSNPAEAASEAHQIASMITSDLRAALPNLPLVEPSVAVEFRSRPTPDGKRPRPSEVARACGATQAVYVDLTRYSAASAVGNDAVEGDVEASVWVFDARTGTATWPAESNLGKHVTANVPFTPVVGGQSEEGVRHHLNQDLATKISRLFTGWTEG